MGEQYKFICLECGHKFRRTIGANTIEVVCPRCKSIDTTFDDYYGQRRGLFGGAL